MKPKIRFYPNHSERRFLPSERVEVIGKKGQEGKFWKEMAKRKYELESEQNDKLLLGRDE